MKITTQLVRFSFVIVFLFPFVLNGQHFRLDPGEMEKIHHETPGDAYLPNKHSNKKTTPAFKYQYRNTKTSQLTGSTIFTNQVNVNAAGQNISDDAANEPNIAVNPLNPNEMVIGWRQFDNVSSNFRQAGWAYSSDAGQTWTFPGVIDSGIFRSDPVLDYDLNGNFYYNSLTVNGNQYPCKVFESTDGGVTWNNGVDIGGGDKQWMTIDRTGGIGNGNIYSTWTQLYSFCWPGNFTRSSTGGSSFESCTPVAGIPAFGTMAVGINGSLFIGGSGWTSDTLAIAKSPNAKIPGSTINWNTVTIALNASIGFYTPVNPDGILGQVNIDIDRSSGPGSGNIYVALSVILFSGDPGDVIFMKSVNGGTIWSAQQKVNDDTSTSNTQWFATMSVAPNGRIDIVWLDTRDAPAGSDSSALYYSYSVDQGATWSANEKMSAGFDPHVGYPNQDKMGDYFDMISDNNGAHLAWANTFNGEQDVYYSHIVPSILTGKDEIALNSSFSVFPNPSNGAFVIAAPASPYKIEITDMLGENVFSMTMLKAKNEINISDQPAGIYFLKITLRDGRIVVKKIIRE
ncbi:MAG TPA: T9SS type A sorting domain-containing protein [Bacteroidia bacterium]|nr:T9SS type A sorting domain-containing protein [Bacteroidia bacterium]